MFKTTNFFSLKYLSLYISLRSILNENNFWKYDQNEIKMIGTLFNKDLYQIYKRNMLSKYISKKDTKSQDFVYKIEKYCYLLQINLMEFEFNSLDLYKNQILTKVRHFKEIDFPSVLPKKIEKYTKYYFKFLNVILAKKNDLGLFKIEARGNIYFFRNHFFITNQIYKVISPIFYFSDLILLEQNEIYTRLVFKQEDNKLKSIYLRYKYNDIIFITIQRFLKYFHKKILKNIQIQETNIKD